MDTFYLQMTALLTNPPGNLIYHIVLAFAITAALQGVLISRRAGQSEALARALFGLGLVLAAQVVLFLTSGLAWQGLANPHIFLPPLDRLVTLFSLLWIAWLWGFPRPARLADALVGLSSLVLILMFFFTLNQWGSQPPALTFNGSAFAWAWEAAALGLLLVALLVLILRRPDGWGIGLGFMLLNLAGHAVQFLWPTAGDFSGIVRLAQLCSFPLLPALAQRMLPAQAAPATAAKPVIHIPNPGGESKIGAIRERRRYGADPRAVHAWLAVAAQTDPAGLPAIFTHAVAQTMLADICFFLADPGPSGNVVFRCGYDLIREEEIPGMIFERERIPALAAALQRARAYRLETGSMNADLKALGEQFGLASVGSLLLIPLATPQKNLGGFLLLSPYSNRNWTGDDQTFFAATVEPMVQILQRTLASEAAAAQSSAGLAELELLRAQLEQAAKDNRRLGEELTHAQQQPAHPQLEALLAVQKEAQETIAGLQAENERLSQHTPSSTASRQPSMAETVYLEKELRQAMKETARLQNQLADANIQILTLQKKVDQPVKLMNEEREVVASIAQELRQPMASIIGYTDLLLSESAGILGALQRKFLERVKASIERMRTILDDLVQMTALQHGKLRLVAHSIQASTAIDQAVSETRAQLQEKAITLQVDLPEELPELHADRDAIQQILVHLLQNAGAATPVDGTISLKVRMDNQHTADPYLLFQITDTGGGVDPADLSRVFARRYRADNPLIQGIGDTAVGLSIAKTLTEAHGGRVWVESDPGKTTTFSVLLPVNPKPAGETVIGNV